MSLPLTLLRSHLQSLTCFLRLFFIYTTVPGLLPSCPWLVHTHTQSRSWQALTVWGETLTFDSEKMTVTIYRLWYTVTLTLVVIEWHWAMALGSVSGENFSTLAALRNEGCASQTRVCLHINPGMFCNKSDSCLMALHHQDGSDKEKLPSSPHWRHSWSEHQVISGLPCF